MGMCLCKDDVDEEEQIILLSETFDLLVEETLESFGTIVDNDLDSEMPERTEHPMGLNVITCLLEECPLLTNDFCVITDRYDNRFAEQNAESDDVLPKMVLEYLLDILRKLSMFPENPLVRLERHSNSDDFVLRQVGYCARWCLDNYFVIEGRKCSYETVDVSNVNVMLHTMDVSEYFKISPDGLEARCDASSFESVRCTFQVNSGCWYYECLIITPGVMQIGWTTKDSNFFSHEGRGIGDDQCSISFDGCRRVIWHDNKALPNGLPMWTGGSILGCLLDVDAREVIFSLNGIEGGVLNREPGNAGDGFYAAASFMSFQQCRFNFGSEPFRYPPKNRPFNSLNGHARPQDKILPRHLFVEQNC